MPGARSINISYKKKPESGLALILVIFIVALASILVINMTHSSFLSGRSLGLAKNQLQAEYLLKSIVSLSQELIALDLDAGADSFIEPWAMFKDGQALPMELLGVNIPGATVTLEVVPENSKLPLTHIIEKSDSGSSLIQRQAWLKAYENLFVNLGFDDYLAEPDETGLFNGRIFGSRELVGNLNDYQDRDEDSLSDITYTGYESSMGTQKAKNEVIRNFSEIAMIPGFSAGRRQRLAVYGRFTTATGDRQVNINVASREVLRAIEPDLGNVYDQIQNHIQTEGKGIPNQSILTGLPFMSGIRADNLTSMITYTSKVFQVIGKISYGSRNYFVRAMVEKQVGSKTKVTQMEFF